MATGQTATYSGRSIIWNRVKGNAATEPKNIGWGIGGATAGQFTSAANSDVNLFGPATEVRTAGTSTLMTTTQLGDTYQVTGTITCAVAGKTITEAALFDTAAALSGTTTLAATVTSNAVTIFTLGAITGPTTSNFYMQIGNEVVLVTAGQNSTLVTVTRGQIGSSAATSFPSGTPITVGGDGGCAGNGPTTGQTATVGSAQGGNIFAHADFAGLGLNVSDSINFTFRDQLT